MGDGFVVQQLWDASRGKKSWLLARVGGKRGFRHGGDQVNLEDFSSSSALITRYLAFYHFEGEDTVVLHYPCEYQARRRRFA